MPKCPPKKESSTFNIFLSILALLILILTALNLYTFNHKKTEVLGVKEDPVSELNYWQKIVNQNPSYRDGWIQLAKVESEMGNDSKANNYLQIAKSIDPNSTKVLTEEKLISGK